MVVKELNGMLVGLTGNCGGTGFETGDGLIPLCVLVAD